MPLTPDYTLYLVTDRDLMTTPTLEEAVDKACAGGVTLVQLREKNSDYEKMLALANSIKKITDRYGVGLIINDNIRVALESGAMGVHLGQDDMPIDKARKLAGGELIIGASVSTTSEAVKAQADGASYLGVGAMTYTPTKPDAHVTSRDELDLILHNVSIPCVVIGGINAQSIPLYKGIGLAGYAVVSAIMAAPDPEASARNLKDIITS
ncbi:MAG: thiamine phosphate synthase [Coriobacteriales bacterium]|jgi:thiamine-phosphate pyrophosphorylase